MQSMMIVILSLLVILIGFDIWLYVVTSYAIRVITSTKPFPAIDRESRYSESAITDSQYQYSGL